MPKLYYADRIGEIDSTTAVFQESLYLLDGSFTVLGARHATALTAPALTKGDCFLDRFPIDPGERNTLNRHLNSLTGKSLLLRAGNRAVLMIPSFFARTRTFLVAVPEGDLAEQMDAVGNWTGTFAELGVELSTSSIQQKAERDEAAFYAILDWFRYMHAPVFAKLGEQRDVDAVISAIAYRLGTAARLCGCRLSYDLKGLGTAPLHIKDLDLLTGLAFSILLGVHRVAPDQKADLQSKRIFMGEPMLHLSFYRRPDSGPFDELNTLIKRAASAGETLQCYEDPADHSLIHVQFSFLPKELSAQSIKTADIFGKL